MTEIHDMPAAAQPKARLSRRSALYLAFWVLLGAGAATYIAALAFAPDTVRSAFTGESREQKAIAELTRAIAALEHRIADVGGDLDAVKEDLAELAAAGHGLDQRLSALDGGGAQASAEGGDAATAGASDDAGGEGLSTASITVPEDEAAASDADGDEAAAEVPLAKPAKEAVRKAGKAVAALKGSDAEAIEAVTDAADVAVSSEDLLSTVDLTGESGKSADAAAEAEPSGSWGSSVAEAPKRQTFGLELAMSTSPEALRLNWDLLSERHRDILGGLSARAQTSPEDPDSYHLVAGPFRSAEDAISACSELQQQSVSCRLTSFSGTQL
ncbi:MAG: hypothetical protein R3D33_05195 [Hyphomicrobiaceae bacterium]